MKIRTVLGDIAPSELGVATCHEHLLWTVPGAEAVQDPDLGFDSVSAAIAELQYFKSAGGNALVEMSTTEIGRSQLDLHHISQVTQVHVIAATGHHKDKFSAGPLMGKSVEEIASGIVTDIEESIDGTNVKAGVIKAATSKDRATDTERRVILIKELIGAGFSRQIMLSGDTARKSAWHTYNPRVNGIAHLLLSFVPQKRNGGVSEADLHTMLVENPRKFLSF